MVELLKEKINIDSFNDIMDLIPNSYETHHCFCCFATFTPHTSPAN